MHVHTQTVVSGLTGQSVLILFVHYAHTWRLMRKHTRGFYGILFNHVCRFITQPSTETKIEWHCMPKNPV